MTLGNWSSWFALSDPKRLTNLPVLCVLKPKGDASSGSFYSYACVDFL